MGPRGRRSPWALTSGRAGVRVPEMQSWPLAGQRKTVPRRQRAEAAALFGGARSPPLGLPAEGRSAAETAASAHACSGENGSSGCVWRVGRGGWLADNRQRIQAWRCHRAGELWAPADGGVAEAAMVPIAPDRLLPSTAGRGGPGLRTRARDLVFSFTSCTPGAVPSPGCSMLRAPSPYRPPGALAR